MRARGSSPKLQVFNTALLTAPSGLTPTKARADREFWGRLTKGLFVNIHTKYNLLDFSTMACHLYSVDASGFNL